MKKLAIVGASHFVNRMFEACGNYQWAREFLKNSLEAGATKVEFGIEWQAVEKFGAYRRTVADNAVGMTKDELLLFFSTLGEGAKRIGTLKDSLLDRLRYSLRQEQKFFLVGVQGVGETVDQGVGRVVAKIQPLVLDPAQVGEADMDLCGQITKRECWRRSYLLIVSCYFGIHVIYRIYLINFDRLNSQTF